jgi:hypothetical protein
MASRKRVMLDLNTKIKMLEASEKVEMSVREV